jgi:hypothetical protein
MATRDVPKQSSPKPNVSPVIHPTSDGYVWLADEVHRRLAEIGALQP